MTSPTTRNARGMWARSTARRQRTCCAASGMEPSSSVRAASGAATHALWCECLSGRGATCSFQELSLSICSMCARPWEEDPHGCHRKKGLLGTGEEAGTASRPEIVGSAPGQGPGLRKWLGKPVECHPFDHPFAHTTGWTATPSTVSSTARPLAWALQSPTTCMDR